MSSSCPIETTKIDWQSNFERKLKDIQTHIKKINKKIKLSKVWIVKNTNNFERVLDYIIIWKNRREIWKYIETHCHYGQQWQILSTGLLTDITVNKQIFPFSNTFLTILNASQSQIYKFIFCFEPFICNKISLSMNF